MATPADIAEFQRTHGKASLVPMIIIGSIAGGFVTLFVLLCIILAALGFTDAAASVGVLAVIFAFVLILSCLLLQY